MTGSAKVTFKVPEVTFCSNDNGESSSRGDVRGDGGPDHGSGPGRTVLATNQGGPMFTRNRNTKPKPFLSVEEAAMLLGEARSTLYRAVKTGTFPLPVVRIGERIRIPRSAVDRLIAGDVPRHLEESRPLESLMGRADISAHDPTESKSADG
jgi:excisionase family DNA binding protein